MDGREGGGRLLLMGRRVGVGMVGLRDCFLSRW